VGKEAHSTAPPVAYPSMKVRAAVLSFAVICLGVAAGFSVASRLHADDFLLLARADKPWGTAVQSYWTAHDPEAVHYYRPAVRVLQQTVQALVGTHAAVFHVINLLVHGLVTFLLYRLCRSLGTDAKVALWAAALFAIHPAHDEAVFWATGISGLSEAACHLGGLLAFDRFLLGRRRRWGIVAVLCFASGVLFKESALTFPLTAMLLWWYRGHRRGDAWPILGVVGLIAVLGAWRAIIGVQTGMMLSNLALNPLAGLRNAVFYLLQLALPVRSFFRIVGFGHYYHWRDALPAAPHTLLYAAAVLVAAGVVVLAAKKRWHVWSRLAKLGLALAFAAAFPFLFSPYTALRLIYLASAGLSIAVAAIAFQPRATRTTVFAACIWLVVMSASLVERSTAWWEAGRLADRVFTAATGVRHGVPLTQPTVFVDVPRRHLGAFVFPGAFSETLRDQTGSPSGVIFQLGDPYLDPNDIPKDALWYRWTGTGFQQLQGPPGNGHGRGPEEG